MPEISDDVFEQLLLQLIDAKLIDLQHIFVDGTKIEANANKYSFVWKKAINNFDEKLNEKAKALVAEVRALTESEGIDRGGEFIKYIQMFKVELLQIDLVFKHY